MMAGNGVVLKHAGNVQLCALAIEEMFEEVGFPKGLFTTLTIDVPAVEGVIKDPRIAAVTLTGSERAGVAVATQAGEVLKKVVMELGGADPFIVLPDADLDFTAQQAVSGRIYMNAGQTCIAAKRFIVVESVYDEFLPKIKAEMEKLVVGDPTEENTQLGPVCSERALTGIKQQVDDSIAKGAAVVTGGGLGSDKGYYFQPTILTDLEPGMPAYDEEVFGPVMSIFKVKDEDEAVALANSTNFGLGASIFTTNIAHAKELAAKIEAGSVFVNGVTKTDPRLPAGGIKRSGYGRELSHYGLKEFVNIKTVWIK
jgi:succinate-semialdehyde dehydrogenase/glutarate-semialdehyde dehydrogenase